MVRMFFWLVVLLIVAGLGWIRLAPVEVSRWHPVEIEAQAVGNHPGTGRFTAVREVGPDAFARLDQVARATPRTRVLAGSLEDEAVTYQTRTRVFGFPDYTSVVFEDGKLYVFARLQYGLDDLGVNRARVESWLKEAGID